MSIQTQKKLLREEIWKKMEEKRLATFPLPCHGRIPNFVGSDIAANKLQNIPEWKNARTVFVNPDTSQRKVRENALKNKKILIMASPRLTRGFIVITPHKVYGRERFASTIRGAFKLGKQTLHFPKPDLIVTGCVAVDMAGNRIGKGHGYGDKEIKIIKEKYGKVPVATTVHDIQIVDYVPSTPKDEKVDIIVTPTKIIRIKPE